MSATTLQVSETPNGIGTDSLQLLQPNVISVNDITTAVPSTASINLAVGCTPSVIAQIPVGTNTLNWVTPDVPLNHYWGLNQQLASATINPYPLVWPNGPVIYGLTLTTAQILLCTGDGIGNGTTSPNGFYYQINAISWRNPVNGFTIWQYSGNMVMYCGEPGWTNSLWINTSSNTLPVGTYEPGAFGLYYEYGTAGTPVVSAVTAVSPTYTTATINYNIEVDIPISPIINNSLWANDWINEDGIVANVTYTPSTSSGYSSPIVIPYIVTTPVRIEEPKDSFGKYRRWVTTVYFPAVYIINPPKPRDLINWGFTLGSQSPCSFSVCKILDCSFEGSPWACTCDLMDFQPILDDVISIYPPSNAIDQMFKTVTQGSALVTNLSCAIEPEEPDQMEETEFQGKKGFRQKFTCFIANTVEGLNQKLSYPYGSTVIDQNGQVYVIEGWKSSDRLDLLQELKLRINP
jgi:hypothetical protein